MYYLLLLKIIAFFLIKFATYLSSYIKIYAYCLLPNHFHFLIQVKSEETIRKNVIENEKMAQYKFASVATILSETFRRFFITYAKAFNKEQDRRGSLFQKDFKRILVDNEAHFTRLIYYIHANPLKHGYQKNFVNYSYSSYQRILNPKPTQLQKKYVLNWFGGRKNYIDFHKRVCKWADMEYLLLE